MVTVGNATGWNQLIDGNLVPAVMNMFNSAPILNGWAVAILFFVFQFMLYIKSKNITLMWVTGIFFAAMFGAVQVSKSYVPVLSQNIIVGLLILEAGGILYYIFFK